MPKEDLELKSLSQFYGTNGYVNVLGINCTDGIAYIMKSGYSWFVTDMVVMINAKFKDEEFLSVKLKLDDNTNSTFNKATGTIDDGNGKILYTQKYEFTDAKRDLTLFCCDNVLMLSGEY